MLLRHKYCAILTIGLKRMLSFLSLSCFHLACVASFLPPFNRWQKLSCLRDEMSQVLGKMERKEKVAGGVKPHYIRDEVPLVMHDFLNQHPEYPTGFL